MSLVKTYYCLVRVVLFSLLITIILSLLKSSLHNVTCVMCSLQSFLVWFTLQWSAWTLGWSCFSTAVVLKYICKTHFMRLLLIAFERFRFQMTPLRLSISSCRRDTALQGGSVLAKIYVEDVTLHQTLSVPKALIFYIVTPLLCEKQLVCVFASLGRTLFICHNSRVWRTDRQTALRSPRPRCIQRIAVKIGRSKAIFSSARGYFVCETGNNAQAE